MKGLSCGIVGLPNVGKSTLFNALLKRQQAGASNYPFCTIDPNIGIVDIPDFRLQVLSDISQSKKVVPATLVFVDIAGLVQGASKGEGLGNQFLANIRETDIIIHVVRGFKDDDIVHVRGEINPVYDMEVVNLELILSDLQIAENSLQKMQKQARKSKESLPALYTLKKIVAHLSANQPIRSLMLSKDEERSFDTKHFITSKKMIYAANLSESAITSSNNSYYQAIQKYAAKENSQVIPFSAKLEEELTQFSEQEIHEYLSTLKIKETGLNRLIKVSFETLGLITFLTTGKQETRAWTITKHTTAQEGAGKIHTDIQKGFIRAEVITFDDMVTYQGRNHAKEAGRARIEGKDYVIQDGDVILFFHNK